MPKDSLAPSDKCSTALPLLTLEQLALALEAQDISVRIVGDPSRVVSGMAIDSRIVESGNLFVCKGAAFRPAFLAVPSRRCRRIYVRGRWRRARGPFGVARRIPVNPCARRVQCSTRHGDRGTCRVWEPERGLHIVGITGTKGKSTVAYMLRSIFSAVGIDALSWVPSKRTTALSTRRATTPRPRLRICGATCITLRAPVEITW